MCCLHRCLPPSPADVLFRHLLSPLSSPKLKPGLRLCYEYGRAVSCTPQAALAAACTTITWGLEERLRDLGAAWKQCAQARAQALTALHVEPCTPSLALSFAR